MASLIQQRIAIDRERLVGTVYLVIGAGFLVLTAALLVTSRQADWAELFTLAVGVFWLISGLVRRRKAERERLRFEAEHGEQAGRQERPPFSQES